jgi:hypothetical protein
VKLSTSKSTKNDDRFKNNSVFFLAFGGILSVFAEGENVRFQQVLPFVSCIFYTVPFISIQSETSKPVNRLQKTIEATQQVMDITPKQESFNWMNLIWIIYGTVTLIFLIRTIFSYLKIKNLKGEKMMYQNQNILITEPVSPFSFWNTIYLGKTI